MENLFELYKIRWSLILLNDFRREYSHRIENLDENGKTTLRNQIRKLAKF